MKVSESMFGFRGKCVACRQKIRIPTREELDPDTTEVYLKDHPEFLRKPGSLSRRLVEKKLAAEKRNAPLGDTSETVSTAILDILEPLRTLCSLDHKIRRQLDARSNGEAGSGDGPERASLLEYLDRVHKARAEVDEQLRQRLMETVIELAGVNEKIVQAGLSARIGEVEFAAFRNMVDKLRRRRDRLERLQQNIGGWLTVKDPHVAGGYANVSFESIPDEGFQVVLALDPDDPRALFEQHVAGLRDALFRRERAERRIRETEQLRAEGTTSTLVLADCREDCEAEKHRAEAEVAFRRKRLEQIANDCAGDVQTTQVCLDRVRKQFQTGKMEKAPFAALERDLTRSQRDCAKVHSLVTRALVASSAQDVPSPKGTFLKRLSRPADIGIAGTERDSWVAWGSALMLGLSVMLPLLDDLGFPGQALHWAMLVPLAMGVLVTFAGALPWKTVRGFLLGALWVVFTLLIGVMIHETQYSLSAIAVRFRQGGYWLFRPGMILVLLADIGVLGAACLALAPLKQFRVMAPAACGVVLLLLAVVATDFGGFFVARPELALDSSPRYDLTRRLYETSVIVNNAGRRTLVLGRSRGSMGNAFTYVLEHQVEGDRWEAIDPAVGNSPRSVAPGRFATFKYNLPPGNYRARLLSSGAGREIESEPFSLAVPAASPPEPAPAPEAAAKAPENPPATSKAAPEEPVRAVSAKPPTGVDAELRGVVRSESRGPRFSIILYLPSGVPRYLDVRIGDTIYGDWSVNEFNPDRQTVTIGNGDRILILNRGQRIALD
jgi:hypothetical protein